MVFWYYYMHASCTFWDCSCQLLLHLCISSRILTVVCRMTGLVSSFSGIFFHSCFLFQSTFNIASEDNIFCAIFNNSEFSSWHFEIVQTLRFLRFLTRDAFLLHYFDKPLCIDWQGLCLIALCKDSQWLSGGVSIN